ncbi:MAG: hypothetical protein A3J55_02680 [Candidatus Ryanbacteria bacterium RIFCSPHIGHO2_02_FULL_45_17b]|nr:MAG: hypothetical protein A3J55_02680 [Candidatus Ryanbacteria bacterium RIFCSPHIGHO2_02_FULL_45_17b]
MKKVTSKSAFVFKGIKLVTGDHIAFTSKTVPPIEAAFTDVDEGGNMNVFSSFLVPFRHNGRFSPDDVCRIKVLRHGGEAVAMEARNPKLHHGQKVKV